MDLATSFAHTATGYFYWNHSWQDLFETFIDVCHAWVMTSVRTQKKFQRKRSKPKCPRYYARTRYRNCIRSRRAYRRKGWLHTVTVLFACSAASKTNQSSRPFDGESFPIGVDTHASYCLTNDIKDFIDKPIKVHVRIKGIKGQLASAWKGTVRWPIEDDHGVAHPLKISGVYFVPGLPQ